jgi:yecA family protein
MTTENNLDFAAVQAIVTTQNIKAHSSELHGVLTGLVCSGFPFESNDYLAMINDLFNNGEGLPEAVNAIVKQMFSEVWQTILDDSYGFMLMLPDDDDAIVERTNALGAWVQGFNLGFGLQHKDTPVVSKDVKEVLTDFAEIANLSEEVDEDEATEQAYFEISEYVRISALLCFTELGSAPDPSTETETVH